MRWGDVKVGDVAVRGGLDKPENMYLVIRVTGRWEDNLVTITVADLETSEVMMQAKDGDDEFGQNWRVLRGGKELK